MNANLERLTKSQLARLLSLSRRQVDNLCASGVLEKHGIPGKTFFIWRETFESYLRHKTKPTNGNAVAYDAVEVRKMTADARWKELRIAEMEGKLIDVDEVEKQQSFVNANIASRLRAMPAKLSPRLTGIATTAEVNTILTKEIRETLLELVTLAGSLIEDSQPGNGVDRSLKSVS